MLGANSFLQAAQWKIDGKLDQYVGYDDNVFLRTDSDPNGVEGSLIYLITPTLFLSRLSQNWDIQADLSYGYQWYFDVANGDLDQDRQNYNLSTEYRTERQTYGIKGGYKKLPNRYSAAEDTGIFDATTKTTWHIGPSWAYKLSEKDSLNLSADYSENTYSTDIFRPNTNITAKVSWARNWTERLLVSVDALYYYYDSDTTQSLQNVFTSNNYGVTLTGDYKLSEQWGFLGHLGAYLSDADATNTITNTKTTDTSVGPLADLQVKYTGEIFTAALDAGVALKPNGNGGGLRQQVTTGLIVDYKITERLTAGMNLRYYQTELATSNVGPININDDRQNIDVTPTLTYALTRDWLVSASYRYRWQDRTNLVNGTADSNLVYLTVQYNWQGFSFAR